MSTSDLIVIAVLCIVFIGALILMRKKKKDGNGCCGSCSSCSGCSGNKK